MCENMDDHHSYLHNLKNNGWKKNQAWTIFGSTISAVLYRGSAILYQSERAQ